MIPPSITVEIFGNMYTVVDFAVVDEFMPTVRSVISFILVAKFFISKYKALPAVIGQVAVIGPSDSAQVEMYRSKYGR